MRRGTVVRRTKIDILWRILRGQRGVVAIEFAAAAPLLALLIIGTVELGFAARAYFIAADAASVGANYAAHNGWDTLKIGAAVTASSTQMAITPIFPRVPYCGCPQTTGVLLEVACGSTCAQDGLSARRYGQVSARVTRVSIFPKATTLASDVTATAVAQLQ